MTLTGHTFLFSSAWFLSISKSFMKVPGNASKKSIASQFQVSFPPALIEAGVKFHHPIREQIVFIFNSEADRISCNRSK
jgi:hypothetical protein